MRCFFLLGRLGTELGQQKKGNEHDIYLVGKKMQWENFMSMALLRSEGGANGKYEMQELI